MGSEMCIRDRLRTTMTTMNRVTPAGKFRLASNLDERAEELEHIFPGGRPGGRNAIPAELMLPPGTGEGLLGDVRIGAHHYRIEDLKKETRGGQGVCIDSSAPSHCLPLPLHCTISPSRVCTCAQHVW